MDENPRITELRKKLEKDPGSRLFAQLAEELRKEGKHDEAIGVARRGLEKNPTYSSARLTLARALLDAGQPREARSELEQIVKATPDNILAGRLLGEALESLGEVKQAIQQFERTIAFSPGDKAMIERVESLKGRLGAEARAAVPKPQAAPALLFAQAPEPPSVEPPPMSARAASPEVVATVALDRDLASGTISPGSLSVADLQKHFELLADASAGGGAGVPAVESAPAPEVQRFEDTLGFGEMERAESLFSTDETEALNPETSESDAPGRGLDPADSSAETLTFEAPEVTAPDPDLFAQEFAVDVPQPDGSAPEPEPEAAAADSEVPVSEPESVPLSSGFSSFEQEQESPSDLPLAGFDSDATLPLTSLTLADLYLQQGLKAEASAVLSRVVRDEPDNLQARSRFASVSEELTPLASGDPGTEGSVTLEASWSESPPVGPSSPDDVPAGATEPGAPPAAESHPVMTATSNPDLDTEQPEPVSPPPTRAEIRARAIASLKAFQDAAEREAVQQRASEFSIR